MFADVIKHSRCPLSKVQICPWALLFHLSFSLLGANTAAGLPCPCFSPQCCSVPRPLLTPKGDGTFWREVACIFDLLFEQIHFVQVIKLTNVTCCDILLLCRGQISSLTSARSRTHLNHQISGSFQKSISFIVLSKLKIQFLQYVQITYY